MELPKLRNLQITGDISIEPVNGWIPNLSVPFYPILHLIIGPTGSGKSSFIEALAGESQQLSISKDQLAGYTQTMNVYQVKNVVCSGHPMYLVDTPGFSDSKISEVEIMDMVRKWMKDNHLFKIHRILYFTPISGTRLPGSRCRTMEMLKQFLAPSGGQRAVSFVTTMWDTLPNEHTQEQAESNFAQLRDKVCKEFFGEWKISICRFMNTRNSALTSLDHDNGYTTESFLNSLSSASPHLYHDLHERIEGALQVKQMIDSELAQPESQTNTDLRTILENNQRENHKTLIKFIGQLANFRPIPKGFDEAHQRLQDSIKAMQHAPSPTLLQPPALTDRKTPTVVTTVSSSDQHMTILQGDHAIPATASRLRLLEEVPHHIITTTSDEPQTASPTNAPPPNAHHEHLPTSPAQLYPSRLLILKGLLCCLIQAAKRHGKKWFRKTRD